MTTELVIKTIIDQLIIDLHRKHVVEVLWQQQVKVQTLAKLAMVSAQTGIHVSILIHGIDLSEGILSSPTDLSM